MRIISFNANGIRAAARKGFYDWLATQEADFVCIQETKAQEHQLQDAMFCPNGYDCHYVDAQKKGYSGVALYSRHQPDQVMTSLDFPIADDEGRYVQVDVGQLSVVSLYLPSGSSSEERQAIKFEFLDWFEVYLMSLAATGRDYVLCGDWNIAHKKIDIRNWRGNQKNSGFLPEERAWMDKLFGELGFVDAFRVVNQNEHQYTWWSNRGQAWANNVGWRIDYQVITPGIASTVQTAAIYKDERFSDHAPLTIDYDYQIDKLE